MFASIQSTSNMGPNIEDEQTAFKLTVALGHIAHLIDQVSDIQEELLLLQSALEEILPQEILTRKRTRPLNLSSSPEMVCI